MMLNMPTTSNLETEESFEENSFFIGCTIHTEQIEELDQDKL